METVNAHKHSAFLYSMQTMLTRAVCQDVKQCYVVMEGDSRVEPIDTVTSNYTTHEHMAKNRQFLSCPANLKVQHTHTHLSVQEKR